jgi:hypothetical protein
VKLTKVNSWEHENDTNKHRNVVNIEYHVIVVTVNIDNSEYRECGNSVTLRIAAVHTMRMAINNSEYRENVNCKYRENGKNAYRENRKNAYREKRMPTVRKECLP